MIQETPYTAEEFGAMEPPRLRLSEEEDEDDLEDDDDEDDDHDEDNDDDGPDFGFEYPDNTEVDEDGLYPDGSSEDEPGPGMG